MSLLHLVLLTMFMSAVIRRVCYGPENRKLRDYVSVMLLSLPFSIGFYYLTQASR